MTTYRERHLAGHYQPGPSPDEVTTTKAAQDKADELGVDITTVKGTGKDGRITVSDIEAAWTD